MNRISNINRNKYRWALTATMATWVAASLLWLAGSGEAASARGHGPLAAEDPYGAMFSAVGSVSCTSPGNCAAGGYLNLGKGHGSVTHDAFVVGQARGAWGMAHV